MKSRTDYLQSEQFVLIKKAVSTITCLEDLVQVSLTKLDDSGKEVQETLDKMQKVGRENEVSFASYLRLSQHQVYSYPSSVLILTPIELCSSVTAFQRVARYLGAGH